MNKNTDPSIFYNDCLNSNDETSKIFKYINLPYGIPFYFVVANCFTFCLLESFIHLYFITLIPCLLICLEYYRIVLLRKDIFSHCLFLESIYQKEWEEKGVDPNYPSDPHYVIDSDRVEIFYECLMEITNDYYRNYWKTIFSKRIQFILSNCLIYFLFYSLGNLIF